MPKSGKAVSAADIQKVMHKDLANRTGTRSCDITDLRSSGSRFRTVRLHLASEGHMVVSRSESMIS